MCPHNLCLCGVGPGAQQHLQERLESLLQSELQAITSPKEYHLELPLAAVVLSNHYWAPKAARLQCLGGMTWIHIVLYFRSLVAKVVPQEVIHIIPRIAVIVGKRPWIKIITLSFVQVQVQVSHCWIFGLFVSTFIRTPLLGWNVFRLPTLTRLSRFIFQVKKRSR